MITATRTNQHCAPVFLSEAGDTPPSSVLKHFRGESPSCRYQLIGWLGDIVLLADIAFLAGAAPRQIWISLTGSAEKDGRSVSTDRQQANETDFKAVFIREINPTRLRASRFFKAMRSGMSTIVVPSTLRVL